MKGNLLKITQLKKNSPWCDKPEVLLYACFQILVDFIEKEKPQKIVDYKHNKAQKKEWAEIQALYHYWKKERPALEKKIKKLSVIWWRSRKSKFVPAGTGAVREVVLKENKNIKKQLSHLQDQFEKQENEMLQRLIDIRHKLWC